MRPDGRDERLIAAVAGRDEAIADHAIAADALDRRSGEHLAETRHRRGEQVGEARRCKLGARQERAVRRSRIGKAIPRADRKAIVAAVDAVADGLRAARRGIGPSCSIVR